MGTLAVLRDISLLWLVLLTLIAILPFGVLFFYAIKGMIRLRQVAKLYLPIAQEKTRLVADKTNEFSHKVATPIIQVQAKTAQANGIVNAIFTRRKNS
jgi:hypothetical protein